MANNFEIETQEKLNWCWAAVAATVSGYFFSPQTLDAMRDREECVGPRLLQWCHRGL